MVFRIVAGSVGLMGKVANYAIMDYLKIRGDFRWILKILKLLISFQPGFSKFSTNFIIPTYLYIYQIFWKLKFFWIF